MNPRFRILLPAALTALLAAAVASAADPSLELVQTIVSKGKAGDLDHLALDAKGQRLFLSNKANNTLDIFDLKAGQLIKQIPGQNAVQGVAYAPSWIAFTPHWARAACATSSAATATRSSRRSSSPTTRTTCAMTPAAGGSTWRTPRSPWRPWTPRTTASRRISNCRPTARLLCWRRAGRGSTSLAPTPARWRSSTPTRTK